ncbi:AAA family ATPase [Nocardioides sp. GCM10027113]|uniref:helix-turn-helix transcriptional regulator n=1 Tax=unclassified Nocardioides TaxID=2615069 RepID=UPI00361E14DC
MAVHTSDVLVGRDAELTELASLLGVHPDGAGAAPPSGGAVLLSGDAGVGKTRLLTELTTRAETAGWQVFVGHCLDFADSALPYLPFSEVLGSLVSRLPDVVEAVGGSHPALARLQPGRRVLSSAGDSEALALDRSDLFSAVHDVVEAAAAQAPTLLVVEDAHWADQSTRDLLTFLFTRAFAGPVGLVVSYRSDDLHRRHPLRRQVAEWSRLRGVERLALEPLSPPDVRSLIHELHPAPLADAEVADIVDRAEGNAFFVEELVGAASGPGRFVPAELADVLLVRLDRLDDTARQVVRAASVAGRRVSHEMLSAVSGLPESALDDGLRAAVEMNVLVPLDGHYVFRHALLGEAVYDDLLPGERVRLHATFAAALRERRAAGVAAELARHARLALDLDTALHASIEAGDDALAVGGPVEAARHYQQALELVADPARGPASGVDVSKLAVSAAEALTAGGQPIRAAALLAEQLAALPDDAPAEARARMLAFRATALAVTEPDEDPCEVSAAAVALAPHDMPRLRAKVLTVHARMLARAGHYERAEEVGLDALALAEQHDLQVLASDVLTTLSALKNSGPKEALQASLGQAVERAAASGALHAELRGIVLLGHNHQDWAELDRAAEWYRIGVERSLAAGIPFEPWGFESRIQLAWIHRVRGDWDAALALADVPGQAAPPVPAAQLRCLQLQVALARGETPAEHPRALRAMWRSEGMVAISGAALEMELAARDGDADAVVAAYDDVVATMTEIWHEWFSARVRLAATALGGLARLVPSLTAARRPAYVEVADRLRQDARTVLQRFAEPGSWGAEGRAWSARVEAEWARVRWLSGLDGPDGTDQDRLVAAWRSAEEAFEAFGDVHELAQVRTALAGVLRATGDAAGSRVVADQAREAAQRLGARPLLDELRTLGTTPARATGAGSDALTPREREILELVALGRTNGEIGKQLFISTKTVSVHVSNILGKLAAAGRTEAVAEARRRGLLA